MRHTGAFVSVFFCFSIVTFSSCQSLKFNKSTRQTTHHGISPTASVNFLLYFKKKKGFDLQVDSILSAADQKMLVFTLFKKNDQGNYDFVPGHALKSTDYGVYQLSFGIVISLGEGSGKPPEEGEELPPPPPPAPDVSKGFVVYYSLNGKKKSVTINSFQKLENLDAP